MAKRPTIAATRAPADKPAEPQTFDEAVADAQQAWGESWGSDERKPLPLICQQWRIEAEDRLRPVVAFGREHHIKTLKRRVDAQELTQDQADKRLAKGDEVREWFKIWTADDLARRQSTKWQDVLAKRHRLAYLVKMSFIPRPESPVVTEWLGLAPSASRRGPIDHDARMRAADGSFDVQGVA